MCGIAGRLSLRAPTQRVKLEAAARALAHRGPDDEAIHQEQAGDLFLGLAFRRLAILDLSEKGRQPMADPGGRYRIVFNGEIYNYLELKAELSAKGFGFRSGSDTEVLLTAWSVWGKETLPRLNGMFAFALWDARERKLVLARDRFGEKPLFYRAEPESFSFASEMKGLAALAPLGGPDPRFLYRFLQLGRLDDEEATLASGVKRLPPASWVEIGLEKETLVRRSGRWWSIPEDRTDGKDAPERWRTLFDDAVKIRLRSDVPVGSCLSGGLDSGAVVTSMGVLAGGADRHTFTCRMEDPRLDEGSFSREVALAAHANLHEVTPTAADLERDFDGLVRCQEEPFASASIYAQWRVMRLAEESGVTVLLDGQGADETLAGYPVYTAMAVGERLARGRFAEARSLLAAAPAGSEMRVRRQAREHAFKRSLPGPLRHLLALLRTPRGAPSAILVSREAQRAHGRLEFAVGESGPDGWMDAALRFSAMGGPLQMLLRFADRNSMAHSREVRLPFLDHRLVELTFALPEEWKVGQGMTKRVLREATAGRIPDRVRLRREKVGFEAPDALWLSGPLKGWFEGKVREAAAGLSGLVEKSRVEAALAQGGAEAVATLFPLVSADASRRLIASWV